MRSAKTYCGAPFHRFTVVEMLVVVAIILILAALLMPSLRRALQSAHQVACASNKRQLNHGFMTYAGDNYGFLPPSYINRGTVTFAGVTKDNAWVPWYSNLYIGKYIGNSTICSSSFSATQQTITSKILNCPAYVRPIWTAAQPYSGFGDFGFGYNQWAYKNYNIGSMIPVQRFPYPSKTFLTVDTALGYEVKWTYASATADQWSRYWWPEYRHLGLVNVMFVTGHVGMSLSFSSDINSKLIYRVVP